MTELQIKRPLIFFDFESTGPDRVNDRIIQFCFITFFPDGTKDVFESLVNPCLSIPEKVAAIHGITDEKVKDAQPFLRYGLIIHDLIKDADLVGFGCLQFDVPLLFNELYRCGITWDYTQSNIIDACNIYKRQVPRDLSSALKYYCDRTLHGAHNATADTEATRDVFLFQIEKHGLSTDIEQLARYSNYDKPIVDLSGKFSVDEEGDIIFNFSAKKGCKVKHETGMLHWMLQKDFSEDVKIICRRLIEQYEEPIISDVLPF